MRPTYAVSAHSSPVQTMMMFSLSIRSWLLVASGWLIFTAPSHAATVLLSRGEIDISFEEAFAYSLRHTNPSAYEASISKPQATFRVLENLYLLKRVSSLVEQSSLLTEAEREYLSTDLYRRALLDRYLENAVSKRMEEVDWEGLAESEYAQRKAEFKSPEEVRVEHILISIEDVPFDSFVSRVSEVQGALADSVSFTELITRYSDDPSVSRNGGDLGFFSRRRMQPTFSDAAFSLVEPGEITGPVMTRFGAHFLRLVDRREEETLPFERVKEGLIKDIKKATEARLREEFLNDFRAEIEPNLADIDEPALVQDFVQFYRESLESGDDQSK